jgi:hypothetical protein
VQYWKQIRLHVKRTCRKESKSVLLLRLLLLLLFLLLQLLLHLLLLLLLLLGHSKRPSLSI